MSHNLTVGSRSARSHNITLHEQLHNQSSPNYLGYVFDFRSVLNMQPFLACPPGAWVRRVGWFPVASRYLLTSTIPQAFRKHKRLV